MMPHTQAFAWFPQYVTIFFNLPLQILFYYFPLEIPNFLSAEECEHIIKLAGKKGLYESTTLPDIEDQKGEVIYSINLNIPENIDISPYLAGFTVLKSP